MIFGRRKKKAAEETEAAGADSVTDQVDEAERAETATEDPAKSEVEPAVADGKALELGEGEVADAESDEAQGDEAKDHEAKDDGVEDEEADRWSAYDLSHDWREDGPFDFEEVDLEADEVARLDFGSLIVTPLPDCEIRLQVDPDTQKILSILMVVGESAIELSAYAAPRTPGLWAEIREQIVEQTEAAGGEVALVEGPFGTEVVRKVYLRTPDDREFEQMSRTWAAEGPRWLLRGILVGQVAQPNAPEDLLHPFLDTFADLVVRRGDHPMPQGDPLPLNLPEGATPQPASPA